MLIKTLPFYLKIILGKKHTKDILTNISQFRD